MSVGVTQRQASLLNPLCCEVVYTVNQLQHTHSIEPSTSRNSDAFWPVVGNVCFISKFHALTLLRALVLYPYGTTQQETALPVLLLLGVPS